MYGDCKGVCSVVGIGDLRGFYWGGIGIQKFRSRVNKNCTFEEFKNRILDKAKIERF